MIRIDELSIDPVKNPAVLDTGTWDSDGAARELAALKDIELEKGLAAPGKPEIVDPASIVHSKGRSWGLASLADCQRVLISAGSGRNPLDSLPPLYTRNTGSGTRITCYDTGNSTLDRYCRLVDPASGPRALGSTPRLGIGCRMSTAVWPGVWAAMEKNGFASNAIQNSLRELNLLADLKAGKPPRTNHQFSFGRVQEGHTGSSFEGLWNEGVLSAIASGRHPRYGADADHIMVKRTGDGIERAKAIIHAARYYSFYTLDVSDLLDYSVLKSGNVEALENIFPDQRERSSIVSFHRQGTVVGGIDYRPTENDLAGLFGKYARALDSASILREYLVGLKDGVRFDLELSIDENPPEVSTCDNRTSEYEMIFLLLEGERRGLELSHVAPNLGVEKGVDYRCPEGLTELEQRLNRLFRIASQFGVMIDCHSGDDLSAKTRQVIGRGTGGLIHFKVSPSLQVLFGRVVYDLHPELFRIWWSDALEYAKREAADGSDLAKASLEEAREGGEDPDSAVFHHFNFATLGRRDESNQFLLREWFYELPDDVYAEYTRRLELFLSRIAADVFLS